MTTELHDLDESPWRWRLATLAALAIALLVMGPVCGHEFVWWDDQGTIHHNQWLNPPTLNSITHFWTNSQYGLYMPVTASVWVAIASIAHVQPDSDGIALNPWFFHAASVLAHLIATWLVARILRALNATPMAALCGALAFAIHPVQVESVAWASGLKDVLAGMFGFAAVLQYIQFAVAREEVRPWRGRLQWAAIYFVLAMLSKASAMSLPLTLLAMDRWGVGRKWRDVLPVAAGFILLAIPIAIIAVIVQDAVNTPTVTPVLRPLLACDSLAFYLYKLLWPSRLGVDYGRTPAVVVAHGWLWWDWIFPVGLALLLWLKRCQWPVLLAAGAILVAGCLPTIGFSRSLYQFFSTTADHYLYASMLGPALAIAWLLSINPSPLLKVAVLIVLGVWSAMAVAQSRYWQSDYSLFAHAIEVNPRSYVGYGNLGSTYAREDQPAKAAELFRTAIKINPEYALSYSNLGHALYELGDIDGALAADKKAVDLQLKFSAMRPSWVRDNRQVGAILLSRKQYAEAEKYLLAGAESAPDDKSLLALLAEAHHFAASAPATNSTTKP